MNRALALLLAALALLLPEVSIGIPFGGPKLVAWDTNLLITPFSAAIMGLAFTESAYAAAEGADAVAIVTEWDAFRALDLRRVKTLLRQPVLVDLRNIYRPSDLHAAGFAYTSIGRT